MTESELSFTDIVFIEDAILMGKLQALRNLYQEYLNAKLHKVKSFTTNEILNVIRTLILNLEEVGSVNN